MNDRDLDGETAEHGARGVDRRSVWQRRLRHARVTVGLAVGGTLIAACSFLLSNENETQCNQDSDCKTVLGTLAQQPVCQMSTHTCVKPPGWCKQTSDCPIPEAGSASVYECASNLCTLTAAKSCMNNSDCTKYYDSSVAKSEAYCSIRAGMMTGFCNDHPAGYCTGDLGETSVMNPCMSPSAPYCNSDNNTCQECRTDAQCVGQVLNDAGKPVPAQCTKGACTALPVDACRTMMSVQGMLNTDCDQFPGRPYCIPTSPGSLTGDCLYCVNDSECSMGTDAAPQPTQCTATNQCEPLGKDVCRSGPTYGDSDCVVAPGLPYCVSDKCVQCKDDSQCSMGTDASPSPSTCVNNACVPVAHDTCRSIYGNADCRVATSTTMIDGGMTTTPLPFCLNDQCVQCLHNTDCAPTTIGSGDAGVTNPALCLKNVCQPILTADCTSILGTPTDYETDGVIVYGAEFVTAGNPNATTGAAAVDAVALTRQEWLEAFPNGLPGPNATSPQTPFIFVVCNELSNAARAATHLAEDLGAVAIIGPQQSSSAYTIGQSVAGPDKVVNLTAASTGALSSLNNTFSFRDGASDLDFIPLQQYVVTNLQTKLQTAGTIQPNQLKVGVFYRGDIVGTYLEPAIVQNLVFNSQMGTANLAATPPLMATFNYGFSNGQPATGDGGTAQQTAAAIANLVAYAPNVIIMVALGEGLTDAENIEANWPATSPPPYYIFYATASSYTWSTWGTGVASNPGLQQRILFVNQQTPAATDALAASVLANAKTEFLANVPAMGNPMPGFVPATVAAFSTGQPEAAYDTSHLVLLGSVAAEHAASSSTFTATQLAAALETFGPGGLQVAITGAAPADPVTQLSAGVAALQGPNTVEYWGITGAVHFDPSNDNLQHDALFCVGATNNNTPTGVSFTPGGAIAGTCGGACATVGACP